MKRLLFVLLAFAIASSLMAVTIYEEDFESYETGTELVGNVEGWAFFSTYDGSSTIVENESGISSKCLKMQQTDGGSADYDMIFSPKFDMSTEDPLRQPPRTE